MSPRSLEEQFLANGGYFEKCKAETLFSIQGNPQLDKENFTFSSDSEYPYFTRTVFNNGILGYVDYYDEDHLIKGNSIAVGMMGMQFFYMPHNFYAGQFTKTAFPLFEGFNEWVAQWFISWFNKSSEKFLSLLVRDFEKAFRETEIVVPIKANGDLAIDFIESLVRSYKDYHIAEVNEYFDSTGFEDCTLTIEEEQTIKCYKKFNSNVIGDLFDVKKGKRLTKANMIAGDINFIGATSNNNGITAHISNTSHLHRGKLITVTYNGSVGESFYQPSKFWASDDVNVMYSKFSMTECLGLYFVTLFRKQGRKYGYSYKWTKELMEKDSVFLPIDIDGSVDYRYMETYIRAIMKQTIGKLKAAMTIESQEVTIEKDEPAILDFVEVQDRFNTYLPVYPLRAACGYFDECGKLQDEDAEGWIDASGLGRTLNNKMFVVHAEGDSMEPKIHDGDFCVFDASGAGSREGKIVLCKARDKSDRNASSFTIKKYHSEKIATEEGWMHSLITLSPLNVNYNPIIISVEEAEEDEFKIYGEFICII